MAPTNHQPLFLPFNLTVMSCGGDISGEDLLFCGTSLFDSCSKNMLGNLKNPFGLVGTTEEEEEESGVVGTTEDKKDDGNGKALEEGKAAVDDDNPNEKDKPMDNNDDDNDKEEKTMKKDDNDHNDEDIEDAAGRETTDNSSNNKNNETKEEATKSSPKGPKRIFAKLGKNRKANSPPSSPNNSNLRSPIKSRLFSRAGGDKKASLFGIELKRPFVKKQGSVDEEGVKEMDEEGDEKKDDDNNNNNNNSNVAALTTTKQDDEGQTENKEKMNDTATNETTTEKPPIIAATTNTDEKQIDDVGSDKKEGDTSEAAAPTATTAPISPKKKKKKSGKKSTTPPSSSGRKSNNKKDEGETHKSPKKKKKAVKSEDGEVKKKTGSKLKKKKSKKKLNDDDGAGNEKEGGEEGTSTEHDDDTSSSNNNMEESPEDLHRLLDDIEIDDMGDDFDIDPMPPIVDEPTTTTTATPTMTKGDWEKRISREEVFSKRYKPSKSEQKELVELAENELGVSPPNSSSSLFQGIRASVSLAIMGNADDTNTINKLFYGRHSIILKRGSGGNKKLKLSNGNNKDETTKMVELVLLTGGFVLTLPDYSRLNPLEKRYETCHLWSEVDYCQKVSKSKFVIQLLGSGSTADAEEDTEQKEEMQLQRYELEIVTADDDKVSAENDNDGDGGDDDDDDDDDVKSWFRAIERIFIEHSMHQGRPETFSDSLGWQYRLIRTAGYSAAVVGDPTILGKPKNLNKLDTYNQMSPLHYAVQRHEDANAEVVKALLDKGSDPNFEDVDGRSAMYYAERNKLVEIKKILESRGGKPSKLAEMEERGELFSACEQAAEKTERRREKERIIKENEQAARDEKAAKAAAKAESAQSEMSKAMSALAERGEKIQLIGDKTEDLQAEAKNFKDMASQLKEKTMKKKWYHL